MNLIYIESPLQLISCLSALENNENSLLLFRGKNGSQLNLLSQKIKIDNQLKVKEIKSLWGLFIFCFQSFIHKRKYVNLYLGDFRSGFSIFLKFFIPVERVWFLDDGYFSVHYDGCMDENYLSTFINYKFGWLRKILLNFLFEKCSINRMTFFAHKIFRTYDLEVRSSLLNNLGLIDVGDIKNDFNRYNSIFIESPLDDWLDYRSICHVNNWISSYLRNKMGAAIVLLHRKSDINDVFESIRIKPDSEFYKSQYPIEFMYPNFNPHSNEIVCVMSTAIITLLAFNSDFKVTILDIEHLILEQEKKVFYRGYMKMVNELCQNVRVLKCTNFC